MGPVSSDRPGENTQWPERCNDERADLPDYSFLGCRSYSSMMDRTGPTRVGVGRRDASLPESLSLDLISRSCVVVILTILDLIAMSAHLTEGEVIDVSAGDSLSYCSAGKQWQFAERRTLLSVLQTINQSIARILGRKRNDVVVDTSCAGM